MEVGSLRFHVTITLDTSDFQRYIFSDLIGWCSSSGEGTNVYAGIK